MTVSSTDRYILISADTHAGAELRGYRDHLESRWHDEFDRWADEVEAQQALMAEAMNAGGSDRGVSNVGIDGDPEVDGDRNWDMGRRQREQESDGVVAEVCFPNTQPPFAPLAVSQLEAPKLSSDDFKRRWAGLRAHNRWAADFASQSPERVAPVIQIFLGDVEGSVEEVRWGMEHGLRGGVLLPGAPPGSGFEPLYSPVYEPIWSVCEEVGATINHHSGGATPDFGPYFPASLAMFMLEVTWWSHRALWHLMFSGVFERHPNLQFVNTESGTAWIVDSLAELDSFYRRMKFGRYGSESIFGSIATAELSLQPSEYWQRQCHIGASFLRPAEAALRHQVGVDRIAWGNDYPHIEGTHPYNLMHLRRTFAGVDPAEVEQMTSLTAARLYHFELDALRPIADRVGPTHAQVFEPLPYSEVPEPAHKCPALAPHTQPTEV
jgi:predicted TIM-barrel fold metal-dependent hydrolase